jgi:outer membrane protein assembly factor BamA
VSGFDRFVRFARFGLFLFATSAAAQPASPGVVAEIRIHGNHTTPDADVLAIVGDVVGKPATDALIADIAARLEKSGRFDGVDVRKRYRSIDNPDDILLMVVVDEVTAISDEDLTPGPLKKFRSSGMFMPVLNSEDGYGFTYGMRISFVDLLGPRSRVSFPLTWGGERQARAQLERSFTRGPIERLSGEAGIGRRENPHFEIADTRVTVKARAESVAQRWLRLGVGGGYDDVKFGDLEERVNRVGGDVTIDTRVDPGFPRNAVHAVFGVERLSFDSGRANRRTADVRGYVGLLGQTVLAVRGLSVTSKTPLPLYEQNLLGGDANLRGFDAGYKANDNIAAVSAELRIPVTSPLSIGRFGVKVFTDAGAAYAAGEQMVDQKLEAGYGGGLYFHMTILRMSFDVAKAKNQSWKWHFGLGVTFQ